MYSLVCENCNTEVISDQFLCNRVNYSESNRTPFEENMRATGAFSLMNKLAFQNMQDILSMCIAHRVQFLGASGKELWRKMKHHRIPLSVDVGRKLVPIFRRLTEKGWLERCKHNRTQNPNESLHNVIWRFCPKITYVGRKVVETAVCLAICQISMGSTFKALLFRILRVEPGEYLEKATRKRSMERVQLAEKASNEQKKRCRRKLRYEKTGKRKKQKSCGGHNIQVWVFPVVTVHFQLSTLQFNP